MQMSLSNKPEERDYKKIGELNLRKVHQRKQIKSYRQRLLKVNKIMRKTRNV